jgi:hypothetical protein
LSVVSNRPATIVATAANTVVALLRFIDPSLLVWERSQYLITVACLIAGGNNPRE